MTFLYLALNIGSLSIPLLYSIWERQWHFIQYWRPLLLSTTLVAIPFLLHDVFFTQMGVWGFNPMYHLSLPILGLPLEEILFFFCIPYASIFTHYALVHYRPNWQLSPHVSFYLSFFALLMAATVACVNIDKYYTFSNYLVLSLLLVFSMRYKSDLLQQFWPSFLVILLPFFLVNGILTGSFIEQEVVWYNDNHNLGIRLFTIPIEDAGYAFSMLFSNIILFEYFKKNKV